MLKKLRTKFICFSMSLVFVLLCIIFGMVYGFTAGKLEDDSLQMMRTVGGPPGRQETKRQEIAVPYLILEKTDEGNWITQGSDYYDLEDQTFLNGLWEAVSQEDARSGVLKAYNMRYQRETGRFQRYVFLDISAERATLQDLVGTCLFIGVISLVLFFGITVLLSRVAMRPVEEAWAQQKQFIADASHELKTPLTVIMTNAELLEDESYPLEERRKFGQNILTMSLHMRHLVESLLELARLENLTPISQPLDFSLLTETALLPFEPLLFEANLLLDSHILPDLWVSGNPSRLNQIIEIFLDNAQKYAAPGVVTVRLEKSGNHALLQVQTPGVPLNAEEAKNIFLRFYRTDTSRKRDGSYGLGLSIAQKITQQHNGKIWAEGLEHGNRFSLLLPLCHKEHPEQPK